MNRWSALVVGLLVLLTVGGVVWWAGHESDGMARTVSDSSLATSTPTLEPTVTPSATATSTPLSLASSSDTPTDEDASVVVAEEEGDFEENDSETQPVETPSPHPTPTPVVHVVEAGDTLGSIAVLYNVRTGIIAEANELDEDTLLQLGQEILIPVPREDEADDDEASDSPSPDAEQATATPEEAYLTHTVGEGDTLGSIAVQYGVSTEDIAEANDLRLTTLLQLGQELVIPGLTPTPAPSPTATSSPSPEAADTPAPTPTVGGGTPTPTLPYRQPQLLAPPHGSMVRGDDADVVLNWMSVGVLEDDEWYMLYIWPAEEDEPMVEWTKTTSWRVPPEMYPGQGVLNAIHWQVTVAMRPDEEAEGVPISLPSERYTFLWR